MADITLTTNTFAGVELAKLLSRALLAKDGLVEKGLVTPYSNIKKRQVLRKADISVELQDPSATFTSQSGGLTLDEQYFIRGKADIRLHPETFHFFIDEQFSTSQIN